MSDVLDDLRGLYKQATTERSHCHRFLDPHYVGRTCLRAIEEIVSLRKQWSEGVGSLLDKVEENKKIIDDVTTRLKLAGIP